MCKFKVLICCAAAVLCACLISQGLRDLGVGVLEKQYEFFLKEQARVFGAAKEEVECLKAKVIP